MRYTIPILVLGALAVVAGCEEGPTVHGWTAVEAAVVDEAAPAAELEGVFHAHARVSIHNGTGWIDLGGPSTIQVPLQDPAGWVDIHGRATIPSGSYSRVRLVLTSPEARLGGGDHTIRVGDGGDVVVEREIEPFHATGGIRIRLLFDLNSHVWLTDWNGAETQVPEAGLRDATTVRRVVEPR